MIKFLFLLISLNCFADITILDPIFAPPNSTSTAMPTCPGDIGCISYQTDTNSFTYWNGSIWKKTGATEEWTDTPPAPYMPGDLVVRGRDLYLCMSTPDPSEVTFSAQMSADRWVVLSPTDGSSSLATGGTITKGPGANEVTVTAGTGLIVNPYDSAAERVFTKVVFNGATLASTIPNNSSGYVIVDRTVSPAIPKILPGIPPLDETKKEIVLGSFDVGASGEILSVGASAWTAGVLSSQVQNKILTGGISKVDGGGALSPVPGTLNINRTAQEIYAFGVNPADRTKSDVLPVGASTPLEFYYSTSDVLNIGGGATTTYSPNLYQPNGLGVLVQVPTGKYTLQHFYQRRDGSQHLQYGQKLYDTMQEAIANWQVEEFVVNPTFTQKNNYLYNGIAIAQEGASDLSLSNAAKITTCGDNGCTGASTAVAGVVNGDVFGPASSIDNAVVVFDGTDGKKIKMGTAGEAGFIFDFGGANCPAGYLLADGTAVSRTTYARLFTAIGITWGTGDGSTTFNLPNLTNRYVRGSGTSAVGTLQAQMTARPTTNLTTDTYANHVHAVSIVTTLNGSHAHTVNFPKGDVSYNNGSGNTYWGNAMTGGTATTNDGNHTHTVSGDTASAGGHSHSITGGGDSETRPVSAVVLKCIKD